MRRCDSARRRALIAPLVIPIALLVGCNDEGGTTAPIPSGAPIPAAPTAGSAKKSSDLSGGSNAARDSTLNPDMQKPK